MAAHLTRGTASRVADLIYGADLTGVCFGALLSSTFFIPILGISHACCAVAMLALAGLALVLLLECEGVRNNGGSKRLTKTRSRTAVARLSLLPYNDRRTIHGVRPPRDIERPQRMAGDERSS